MTTTTVLVTIELHNIIMVTIIQRWWVYYSLVTIKVSRHKWDLLCVTCHDPSRFARYLVYIMNHLTKIHKMNKYAEKIFPFIIVLAKYV